MLYSVLIGAGSLATDRPVVVSGSPTYTKLTISMSSPNTQDSVLTSTVTPTSGRELFGYRVLRYTNSFNKIDNIVDVVCTYLHSLGTSLNDHVYDYKLYHKPETDEVFGVVYLNNVMVSPATIPTAWNDYIKDLYVVDKIHIDLTDIHWDGANWFINSVFAKFDPAGGTQTFTLRVGYKHEETVTSGVFLIDTFVGYQNDGTDYGLHYTEVYKSSINTPDLYYYHMPTRLPNAYREIGDGSTSDEIKDIYDELGPIKVKINEARDLFVSR